MKILTLLISLLVAGIATAAPEDAILYNYGEPGCEHTTSTNHFVLGPGEVVELQIDLTQCPADMFPAGFLYFGYYTTKNRSRQLVASNKIDLEIISPPGISSSGRDEREWADLLGPAIVVIRATNEHHKEATIRLRTQLIQP